MKVKFKDNNEPCVVYRVLSNKPEMQFDEITYKKYVLCYNIEILGWVPVDLLQEIVDHQHNIPAIDLAVELSK